MLTNYNTIQQYQNWFRTALIQGSQIRAVCYVWQSFKFVDWSLSLLFHEYFWVIHFTEWLHRTLESGLCVLFQLSITVYMFGSTKLSGLQVRPFSRVNHDFLFTIISWRTHNMTLLSISADTWHPKESFYTVLMSRGRCVGAVQCLNQIVLLSKWAV